MCDKCVELDKKIERYRRVSFSLADQITIDRIKTLIDELRTEKVELQVILDPFGRYHSTQFPQFEWRSAIAPARGHHRRPFVEMEPRKPAFRKLQIKSSTREMSAFA
jgi:hypothetical protein